MFLRIIRILEIIKKINVIVKIFPLVVKYILKFKCSYTLNAYIIIIFKCFLIISKF